jgi:hypothetical protein
MAYPDYRSIRNRKARIKYSLLQLIERLKFTPFPKGYPINLLA